MSAIIEKEDCIDLTNYPETEDGFKEYLHDLGDDLFPFPDYREYQDEILYETLEAMFVENYRNVVIEGPTGIGKSPFNVAVSRVIERLNIRQHKIFEHFDVVLTELNTGKSFYTTPQKSLRNQLAEDDDLQEHLNMLKSRRDYTCGVTNNNCSDCMVRSSTEESCSEKLDCTYWNRKMSAIESTSAVITFAMLIVDNYMPHRSVENDAIISFDDRDLVIIDEGHNAEGQSSSLFAGFTLSPWSLPRQVYDDAGERVDWTDDKYEDVQSIVMEIQNRAKNFIQRYEGDERQQSNVEKCENIERKISYCNKTHEEGRGWVANIKEVAEPVGNQTTKAIEIKPVRVDDFLKEFVWSRGSRRLITSATIPFRGNVDEWADRIGLDGDVKFISKRTPFPEQHRLIHLNTIVGEMSGDNEDRNWPDAMDQIREIHSHHQGERGLIHTVSYPRAKRVAESLDCDVILDEKEKDTEALITKWQNSDTDIMLSPTMMQGVDLHTDRCRWQVLLKAPFAYAGDSRVSYLLNEENEWGWYFEETGMDIIQSVGRAVRGPEPEEAASMYIIDSKFHDVMERTNPPQYFVDAIRDDPPTHWTFPKTAPWRGV
jgi:ATP-dependent DNA helicase DinG